MYICTFKYIKYILLKCSGPVHDPSVDVSYFFISLCSCSCSFLHFMKNWKQARMDWSCILGFVGHFNLGGSSDGSVGVSGCGIVSVQFAVGWAHHLTGRRSGVKSNIKIYKLKYLLTPINKKKKQINTGPGMSILKQLHRSLQDGFIFSLTRHSNRVC